MKNPFYFMLEALFVFGIFEFLSWLFGYVEKRFDKKAMVIFKFCHVTDWITNLQYTHGPISQEDNHTMKFGK